VVELFSPQNVVLDGTFDPCALLGSGKTATDPTVVKCASLFGINALTVEPDPAHQYNGKTGGNPNLKPETADTYTVGFVWQPSFLPGANLSVDYFDIKVEDYISNIGADVIMNGCFNGTNPEFCALVHRDAVGGIRSNQGFVIDTVLNTGSLHTAGVDINASYRTNLDAFGLQNLGSVSANFVGTYLDKLVTTVLKGGIPEDCAGLYGSSSCDSLGGSTGVNPKWRHKLRLTWNTPYEYKWMSNLALSLQWRYFDSVSLDANQSNPLLNNVNFQAATDSTLGSRSYIDLLATFKIKDNYSFRIGVNNVLDNDPPLAGSSNCPAGPCNQNVYAQTYDALGRYFFFGITADF
jgi:outer membrane receptor protein involved in Fe transport